MQNILDFHIRFFFYILYVLMFIGTHISVFYQIVTLQCLRQLVPWLASAQRLAQARAQAEPLAFFTQATERLAQVVATSLNCR